MKKIENIIGYFGVFVFGIISYKFVDPIIAYYNGVIATVIFTTLMWILGFYLRGKWYIFPFIAILGPLGMTAVYFLTIYFTNNNIQIAEGLLFAAVKMFGIVLGYTFLVFGSARYMRNIYDSKMTNTIN